MGFMALLSHQTAPVAVATPVPVIIEAPKGAVTVVEAATRTAPVRVGSGVSPTPTTATVPFFNPNYHYMEPENIPEPVEVTEVENKPEYIAPKEETPGHVDGTEYSTQGY